MNEELKTHITSSKHWVRLVYMLLFSFFLYIASIVVAIVVVAQFLFALVTGSDNEKLRHLGSSIALYVKEVLMFLTFNSEEKAFPFADWPEPQTTSAVGEASASTRGQAVEGDAEVSELKPTSSIDDSATSSVSSPQTGPEQDANVQGEVAVDQASDSPGQGGGDKPRRKKAKQESPDQIES